MNHFHQKWKGSLCGLSISIIFLLLLTSPNDAAAQRRSLVSGPPSVTVFQDSLYPVPINTCTKRCYAVVRGAPGLSPVYQGDFAIGYLILPYNAKCNCTPAMVDSCAFTVRYELNVDDGTGYRTVNTGIGPTDSLIFAQWHGGGIYWTGCQATTNINFSQWGTTYKLGCNSNKEVTMAVKTGVPVSPTPFSNPTAPLDTVELEIQFGLRCTPCIDILPKPCAPVMAGGSDSPAGETNKMAGTTPEVAPAVVYDLYPNPGSSEFHLDFDFARPAQEVVLTITDMSGKLVTFAAFNVLATGKNSKDLSLGELAEGDVFVFTYGGWRFAACEEVGYSAVS